MNELMNINTNENSLYCSFVPQNDTDRAILYKALNAPDRNLADMIGATISIKDVVAEDVIMNNEDGTQHNATRVGLILTDGTTVTTASVGIYRAVKHLMLIYGNPTWDNGIKVKITQINRNNKRVFTLIPVFD